MKREEISIYTASAIVIVPFLILVAIGGYLKLSSSDNYEFRETEIMGIGYSGKLPVDSSSKDLEDEIFIFCNAYEIFDGLLSADCIKSFEGAKFVFRKPWSSYTPKRDVAGDMVGETLANKTIMLATRFPDQPNKTTFKDTALHHELVHYIFYYAQHGDPCATHSPDCGWTEEVDQFVAELRK